MSRIVAGTIAELTWERTVPARKGPCRGPEALFRDWKKASVTGAKWEQVQGEQGSKQEGLGLGSSGRTRDGIKPQTLSPGEGMWMSKVLPAGSSSPLVSRSSLLLCLP